MISYGGGDARELHFDRGRLLQCLYEAYFFFFLIDFIANKKKYTIKYSGVKVLVVV